MVDQKVPGEARSRALKVRGTAPGRGHNISLLVALVTPFIVLLTITVGLSGYISFHNAQKGVQVAVDRLRAEIVSRIEEHLETVLSIPHQINQLNLNGIRQGWLNPANQLELGHHFWHQINVFKSVTSIYFGNSQGGLVNSGREGAKDSRYVILTDGFAAGTLRKYATDRRGDLTDLLVTVPNFNSTVREWYTRALKKGGPTWSPVYILSTGQDMAIAASCPVYDEQNKILGVVSVDLFLSHLTYFLQSLKIGETGQAYIMERSGRLIASSTKEIPVSSPHDQSPPQRLQATESVNPIIKESALLLNKRYPDLRGIVTEGYLEFDLVGERQILQVSTVTDDYGLDWLVVVVIPEKDFMSIIQANNRVSVITVISALFIAVLIGILASKRVTSPILRLKAAAKGLADGDRTATVIDDSRVRELSELTRSFNRMSTRLQSALENLQLENEERTKTAEALRESEAQYKFLADHSADAIYKVKLDNEQITYASPAAQKLFGYSTEEALSLKIQDLLTPESYRDQREKRVKAVTNGNNDPSILELVAVHQDGHTLPVEIHASFIFDEQGNPVEILGVARDITERKRAEDNLRKALKEKEILLQEVHHRVKNNLQVVMSLLNMQSFQEPEARLRLALQDSRDRIRAMALIHETLHRSTSLVAISLGDYTRHLVRILLQSFKGLGETVTPLFSIEEITLPIDQAAPYGLILNELITNSLKYASPQAGNLIVAIEAKLLPADEVEFTLRDNGLGLPEDFHIIKHRSLGLNLVSILVEDQLLGEINAYNNQGAVFNIRWPYSELAREEKANA